MVDRELERSNLRSFSNFLKMEFYQYNSSDGFNTFRRRGFESSQNPKGSSSLHFVEDFYVVGERGLVVKPQLKAI